MNGNVSADLIIHINAHTTLPRRNEMPSTMTPDQMIEVIQAWRDGKPLEVRYSTKSGSVWRLRGGNGVEQQQQPPNFTMFEYRVAEEKKVTLELTAAEAETLGWIVSRVAGDPEKSAPRKHVADIATKLRCQGIKPLSVYRRGSFTPNNIQFFDDETRA